MCCLICVYFCLWSYAGLLSLSLYDCCVFYCLTCLGICGLLRCWLCVFLDWRWWLWCDCVHCLDWYVVIAIALKVLLLYLGLCLPRCFSCEFCWLFTYFGFTYLVGCIWWVCFNIELHIAGVWRLSICFCGLIRWV